MVLDTSHLHTLARLEPGININDIHAYLCATRREDMINVSRSIVALYEIAESEREYVFRRSDHGIFDEEYSDRAEYKKCFFVNHNQEPAINKVELEYFLNLLYSISFSLYVGFREFFSFNSSFNCAPKQSHLVLLQSFLECIENFYTSLDSLAVLVVLVCGIGEPGVFLSHDGKIDPDPRRVAYSRLQEWLQEPFRSNFHFPPEEETFKLFKAIRNNRAHRPFLDWSYDFMIAGTGTNLMKVQSVIKRQGLFKKSVPAFLEEISFLTCKILHVGLEGTMQTYNERYDYESEHPGLKCRIQRAHDGWSRLLA